MTHLCVERLCWLQMRWSLAINLTILGGTVLKKKQTNKKKTPANAGDTRDTGLIPGSGRYPGGGHGNPLQHSCLGNAIDSGVWWATALEIAKSWTCEDTHRATYPTCCCYSVTKLRPSFCDPPWTAAHWASLSFSISWSLLKLMSSESVMLYNLLVLCHPLLLLPLIFPSIRVFSNEAVLCIKWPKYCSFNFSISPSSEYSGLISFRMDLLDPLAVQGALKSLL